MGVKDYYNILAVDALASPQEIKRAYRKLAQLYHPDKTGGNRAAEARYMEVKEAYEMLSNPVKREKYNFERWNQRNAGKRYNQTPYSPETILAACTAIRTYIDSVDPFRINHQALNHFLGEMLSDYNLAILAAYGNLEINRRIIGELLAAAKPLDYTFAATIFERLIELAGDDMQVTTEINKLARIKRSDKKWKKYTILLIAITTLLLCLLIYFLSK